MKCKALRAVCRKMRWHRHYAASSRRLCHVRHSPAPPRSLPLRDCVTLEAQEADMRSLVGLLVVLSIGYFIYRGFVTQTLPKEEGGGSPVSSISVTGVKNDLIAIAQAERAYFAEHGSYASLSELTSSGAMTMTRSGRDGYTYSVDTQAGGFTVTARYSGPLSPPPSGFMIDQSMEVRAIP